MLYRVLVKLGLCTDDICIYVKPSASTALSALHDQNKENVLDILKERLLGLLRCCLQNTF